MLQRMLISAAAGGLGLAFAGAALAGGYTAPAPEPVVVAPAPVVVPSSDWTGFYAGGQLGWGSVNADSALGDADGNGLIGGLNAGYLHDFGRLVAGGEVQYDWADINLEDDAGADAGSLDSVGRVKGILGYDAGRTLVYGTAGWAKASAELGGVDFDDSGWVAGAGVDYMVTERVSVGGEVLYHQFDDFDDSGIDVDATTVQLKSTFRF